jgi:hypothetical protein
VTRTVLVPPERLVRWCENFAARHGAVTPSVSSGRLALAAADGASAAVELPFDREYDGAPDPAEAAAAACAPLTWGVLLVRKGGFAVALVDTDRVVASKVGQRHVQGRTKAGGQSQQRFARRRDNQARAAYEAAADHAARIIAVVPVLVVGGDHTAVTAVLDDARLRRVAARAVGPFLSVPDPRRGVLEAAVSEACALRIDVTNR